jgi:3-hydroxyisobutyrate dehydrogenase-like beta-hydroxyacid dehydrogenase
MKVAFCGLGRMGRLMAARLPAAGHELTVWNRTPGRADALVALGAREAATVADAVIDVDAVVLMLYGPESVARVLAEATTTAKPGTLVVNCTTVGPGAARDFGYMVTEAGLRYVDAPVVGTVGPARDGMLRILVGASDVDAEAARELLSCFGGPDRIIRVGSVGAGNALKTVMNLSLGVAMAGAGEALRLGTEVGLDRQVLLRELGGGPLGYMINYKRPMLDSGEFTPAAFTLDALVKDIRLAVTSTEGHLPLAEAVLRIADAATRRGHGNDDFSSLASQD